MREGSEVTETNEIQKSVSSSLTWGWAPSCYLRQRDSCILNVISGSQDSPLTSLVAEIPPLAFHFFGFNL